VVRAAVGERAVGEQETSSCMQQLVSEKLAWRKL
jgi:hypothetical protein